MPHVFWELQGVQKPVYVKSTEGEGKGAKEESRFDHFEMVKPGKLSKLEYDSAIADLVAYLDWMSEPTRNLRQQLGVWVLLFLGVLVVLTWRLNASYWKEIK
jgi:ubiquinol-cytochrome c reductase cytochrome c1 subunit